MQKNLKCKDLRNIDHKNFVFIIDAEESVICQKEQEKLNILGKLPMEEFMEFLPQKSISSPILPRNCIQISPTNQGYVMCFEFTPRSLKIDYHSAGSAYAAINETTKTKGPWKYELPLPYIQFYIKVINTGNFSVSNFVTTISNTSVREDENTPVFYFPMPNIHLSGHVCWGVNNLPPQKSFAEAAEFAINLFFNSPFNDHFGPQAVPDDLYFDGAGEPSWTPAYLNNWVQKFGSNPLDILKVKWQTPISIGETYKKVRQHVESH